MVYTSEKDIYEIHLGSIITSFDKDIIIDLYQPLIGALSASLYFSLLSYKVNEKNDTIYKMAMTLEKLVMKKSEFSKCRKYLEAVGLLKTYVHQSDEGNYYKFVLFAPKLPSDFFDDILFKGMLIQILGEEEVIRISKKYEFNINVENFDEISSSFIDVFEPDFSICETYMDEIKGLYGRLHSSIITEFSYDIFLKELESANVNTSKLSKKFMQKIEKISTLYNIDEVNIAYIVIDEIKENGLKNFNFDNIIKKATYLYKFPSARSEHRILSSKISSNSILADKIKLFEKKTPIEFLSIKQGGGDIPLSDSKFINKIKLNYELKDEIINVIIDYTLGRCDNRLSYNFFERVASSIARSDISSPIDAMNFVNKRSTKKNNEIKVIDRDDIKKETDSKTSDTISDEEIAEMMRQLEEGLK